MSCTLEFEGYRGCQTVIQFNNIKEAAEYVKQKQLNKFVLQNNKTIY